MNWFYDLRLRAKLRYTFGAVLAVVAIQSMLASRAIASNSSHAVPILFWGTLLAISVALAAAWVLDQSFSWPVRELSTKMDRLAVGDVDVEVWIYSKDEMGDLANAVRRIVAAQQQFAGTARQLAAGDTNVALQLRSEHDVVGQSLMHLGEALTGVTAEIQQLITAAHAGQLTRRGDAAKFDGAFREIVHGMNQTLDAVIAPVTEAAAVLERVAARDLTARMTGEYRGDHAQIKTALNSALEHLDEALMQMTAATEQVAAAATQISAGSQSLAQGANAQASSLGEVAGSLQELARMSEQSAGNAKEVNRLAKGAQTASGSGAANMHRLTEAVGSIKASASATAKIVKTIDEIAFQTNLLALNAAVEAARAGDAGRGFAVVAEEVRNLAMRSAEAARSTAALIEESVRDVEGGVVLNAEVLSSLREINGQVDKVTEVVAEIAAASEQQSQAVTLVTAAMDQVSQVTHRNASSAEQSAGAAEELLGQAEHMRSLAGSFRLSGARPARQDLAADGGMRRTATRSARLGVPLRPRSRIPSA